MKTRVTILDGNEYKAFPPKVAGGKVNKMVIAQCIVHEIQEDGTIKQAVGVLRANEAQCPVKSSDLTVNTFPDIPPGEYMAEYGLGISWDKKELGGVLRALTRIMPAPMGASVADVKQAPKP